MFRRKHSSAAFRSTGYILCGILLITQWLRTVAYAAFIPSDNNSQCANVLLVFARGSGQNDLTESPRNVYTDSFKAAEPESYAFFSRVKEHLDRDYPHVDYKAVSIHHMGYDNLGYQAAAVGTIPGIPIPIPTANTRNAEVSALSGDYRQSVEHGINETVGYLRDQIANCPTQSIIVGGYSQGAQVMGESLFKLTQDERNHILGAGFFGDPKYIGAKHSQFNPFSSHESYPWRRGDAEDTDTGMLDPRDPYVPNDMAQKTASFCYKVDLVCAGYTGIRGKEDTAHGHYNDEPMRVTVNELVQWAAPALGQVERSRGGFDTTLEDTSTPPPDEKKRNIMFLINDDGWLGYAIGEFRYDTDIVLSPISKRFPNTYYSAKGFGEGEEYGTVLPRVNNIQSFFPYMGYDPARPYDTISNLRTSIAARYPFGQPYTGSGDWPDPHGLAIERAAFDSGWQTDAEKHIVLVTDRAPKTDYSYNICHASVRSWLQIPNTSGYDACFINAGTTDIWPKVQHPEVCETIYKAILQDQCKNPTTQPTNIRYNTRKLDDAIIAAQSQHIAVDIVVPYKVTNPYDPTAITKMQADLQYLSKATGGRFIYYNQRDQFDRATYTDMMLQIFGHKPKDITVAYKEALDGRETFNKDHVLGVHTNQPVILDTSQSANIRYSAYKWDFNNDGTWDEITPGPVTQHTFDTTQTGFIRIAAVGPGEEVIAETHMAVDVTPGEAPAAVATPAVPSITAEAKADGSIHLSWQSAEEGSLVLLDPLDHLYIGSAPLASGELIIPPGVYDKAEFEVRTINSTSASDAQKIKISPYIPIVESPVPEVVEQPVDPQPADTEQPPVQQTDPTPIQGGEPASEQTQPDPTSDESTSTNQDVTITDPTLCYKLQQCQDESTHENIQIPQQTIPVVQLAVTSNAPVVVSTSATEQPVNKISAVEGISETRPPQTPVEQSENTDIQPNKSHQPYGAWITMLLVILLGSISLWRTISKRNTSW